MKSPNHTILTAAPPAECSLLKYGMDHQPRYSYVDNIHLYEMKLLKGPLTWSSKSNNIL